MYFLLLLGCLGIGVIGWRVLPRVAWLGQTLVGLSVVSCLVLMGWQVRDAVGGGAPQTHRSQAAVAYKLANQFLGDTRERRGNIVLVFPPEAAAPAAALDSFYEAYARVMTRFPGIGMQEVTLDASAKAVRNGQVSAEQFEQALVQGTDVLAYVSWVGFPKGAETVALVSDPAQRKPLYVYDALGQSHWFPQIQDGLIQAGVVPRLQAGPAPPDDGPGNPEALFNQSYHWVTRRTVSEVRDALGTATP